MSEQAAFMSPGNQAVSTNQSLAFINQEPAPMTES